MLPSIDIPGINKNAGAMTPPPASIIPETSIGKMIENYINECFYWSIVQSTTTYLE